MVRRSLTEDKVRGGRRRMSSVAEGGEDSDGWKGWKARMSAS
jgi:hypothetical protein